MGALVRQPANPLEPIHARVDIEVFIYNPHCTFFTVEKSVHAVRAQRLNHVAWCNEMDVGCVNWCTVSRMEADELYGYRFGYLRYSSPYFFPISILCELDLHRYIFRYLKYSFLIWPSGFHLEN